MNDVDGFGLVEGHVRWPIIAVVVVAAAVILVFSEPARIGAKPGSARQVQNMTVWQAPASVKLWADSVPIEWAEPLHLARNDSRGFHVAITAQQTSALPQLTASSPSLAIKLWLEAPVTIATPSGGLARTGKVLDALIPTEAQALRRQFASIPAGETRAWWVEVSTTAATPPGRHMIDLRLGDEQWQQEVQVYPVTLAAMPTLQTAFGTGGDDFNEATALAHGITDGLRSEPRFKLMRLYHEDLAANQMAPYSVTWPAVFRGVSQATMLHTFYDCAADRMNWPPAVLDLLDYHFHAPTPVASTILFYYGAYRYETARNFTLCGLDQDDPGFEDVARRFFAAVAHDMEARGYLDRVSFFADEPLPQLQRTTDWWEPLPFAAQPAHIQRVVRAAAASREAGIPTGVAMFAAYAIEYWTNPSLNRGTRPFNRWVFHANRDPTVYPGHPNDYDPIYDGYVQADEQKWIYGGRSHILHTDSDALEQLAMGPAAYKFDMQGILAWAVLQMNPNPWLGKATIWGNGATDLYYPPCGLNPCAVPTYTIVPSYRLKLLAESFRFHHYLKLLEAAQGRDQTLELGMVDAIVWASTVYNHDWRLYEAARTQVLQVLAGASPTITPPVFTPTATATSRPTLTPTPIDQSPAYIIARGSAQVDGLLDEFKGEPILYASTAARALWDDENLYIGFAVEDASILAPLRCGDGGNCDLWSWDSVQALVDPLNNGGGEANFDLPWMEPDDIQIVVSAGSELTDLRGTIYKTATLAWSGHASFAVRQRSAGYDVEMAIPWTDLGITPAAGRIIGFSLAQTNRTGAAGVAAQWQQKGRSFQVAGGWPRVLLGLDALPPTSTATPTPTLTPLFMPTETPTPTPTGTPTPTPTETSSPPGSPSPTATPSPSPTPSGPPRFFIEAESGRLSDGMETGEDARASGRGFVSGRSGHPLAAVRLDFDLKTGGNYAIWLRGMGRGAREKTVMVSLDGAPLLDLDFTPVHGRWDWQWRPLRTEVQAAGEVALEEGLHTLTVVAREPAARLDGVLLTGAHSTPGQVTGAVFVDSNGDGLRNANELYGLSGIPIVLHNRANGEMLTTISEQSGQWLFEDVAAGVYEVTFQPLFSYMLPSSINSYAVVLPSVGDSADGLDFGFLLPTRVIVASLNAQPEAGGVRVEWVSHGQNETCRYAIWRADAPVGAYEQVSDILQFEELPDGALHTWLDPSAELNRGYWYKLELLDENEFFGPIQVDSSVRSQLFLPVIIQ